MPAADPSQVDPRSVPVALTAQPPLDRLPVAVQRVMTKPTLRAQGPREVFRGRKAVYEWLLDHPDQGVQMWRRLGAKCMDITARGDGRFTWSDGQGTVITWETVYRDGQMRIWYAEGLSRPALLLPTVPLRAVVVLHQDERRENLAKPLLEHQADLYLQTDSRTAMLVARLLGASAPRMAEQGLVQLEVFFSALVWYLDRHPEQTAKLLGPGFPG
jgi:hypothetical protein